MLESSYEVRSIRTSAACALLLFAAAAACFAEGPAEEDSAKNEFALNPKDADHDLLKKTVETLRERFKEPPLRVAGDRIVDSAGKALAKEQAKELMRWLRVIEAQGVEDLAAALAPMPQQHHLGAAPQTASARGAATIDLVRGHTDIGYDGASLIPSREPAVSPVPLGRGAASRAPPAADREARLDGEPVPVPIDVAAARKLVRKSVIGALLDSKGETPSSEMIDRLPVPEREKMKAAAALAAEIRRGAHFGSPDETWTLGWTIHDLCYELRCASAELTQALKYVTVVRPPPGALTKDPDAVAEEIQTLRALQRASVGHIGSIMRHLDSRIRTLERQPGAPAPSAPAEAPSPEEYFDSREELDGALTREARLHAEAVCAWGGHGCGDARDLLKRYEERERIGKDWEQKAFEAETAKGEWIELLRSGPKGSAARALKELEIRAARQKYQDLSKDAERLESHYEEAIDPHPLIHRFLSAAVELVPQLKGVKAVSLVGAMVRSRAATAALSERLLVRAEAMAANSAARNATKARLGFASDLLRDALEDPGFKTRLHHYVRAQHVHSPTMLDALGLPIATKDITEEQVAALYRKTLDEIRPRWSRPGDDIHRTDIVAVLLPNGEVVVNKSFARDSIAHLAAVISHETSHAGPLLGETGAMQVQALFEATMRQALERAGLHPDLAPAAGPYIARRLDRAAANVQRFRASGTLNAEVLKRYPPDELTLPGDRFAGVKQTLRALTRIQGATFRTLADVGGAIPPAHAALAQQTAAALMGREDAVLFWAMVERLRARGVAETAILPTLLSRFPATIKHYKGLLGNPAP